MKIANPIARIGEEFASNFLRKKGYKIIERNFRKGYGEIDAIATKDNTLVSIEVKTRISDNFGAPFEAITPWKLNSLVKTAQFYKKLHPNLPDSLRIDAVSVKLKNDRTLRDIQILENISGF